MGSVPSCDECGGIGRHTSDCKTLSLPERLLLRFGRDVPEGDSWSWDWESDPLAREAAVEIRRLWAECSVCTKCGHYQARPDWCDVCGSATRVPPWADQYVTDSANLANMEEYLLDAKERQIEFLRTVAHYRQEYALTAEERSTDGRVIKSEIAVLRLIVSLLEGESGLAGIVAAMVPSWRWHEFRQFDADPS